MLRKLLNTTVTVIPIVIGALGIIAKGLESELKELDIGGRTKTIQTTALLRRVRIGSRVLEIWGDLLFFWLSEKLSANAGVKNMQGI